MADNQTATYLKYANLQMAAEAFLKQGNTIVTGEEYGEFRGQYIQLLSSSFVSRFSAI